MGSTADIFGTAFPQKHSQIHTTLLDLIQAVNQVTTDEDDRLVAATVAHMVNSGGYRALSFRPAPRSTRADCPHGLNLAGPLCQIQF